MTLADTAMVFAVAGASGGYRPMTTVGQTISFMKPASGGDEQGRGTSAAGGQDAGVRRNRHQGPGWRGGRACYDDLRHAWADRRGTERMNLVQRLARSRG